MILSRLIFAIPLVFLAFLPASYSQTWSPLGSGTNNFVNALEMYNNEFLQFLTSVEAWSS